MSSVALFGVWVAFIFILPGLVVVSTGSGELAVGIRQILAIGLAITTYLYTPYGILVSAAIAISPVVLFLLTIPYLYYMGIRTRGGAYGDEAKWIMELYMSDDHPEFTIAFRELDTMEIEEAKIIADSKEELHNEIVDRANRNS